MESSELESLSGNLLSEGWKREKSRQGERMFKGAEVEVGLNNQSDKAKINYLVGRRRHKGGELLEGRRHRKFPLTSTVFIQTHSRWTPNLTRIDCSSGCQP